MYLNNLKFLNKKMEKLFLRFFKEKLNNNNILNKINLIKIYI